MLDFLYTAVSWVLLRWHSLFSLIGIDKDSGLNWALSIVFLVITARLLLVRLFIRQVHYQRRMQELQPKLSALREKHKNDRAAQQREMMKLQQEEGFNPLAGCLPMVAQIPIFIALFHTLRHLSNSVNLCTTDPANSKLKLYSFTSSETCSAAKARLFDAPLAGALRDSSDQIQHLGGSLGATRIVILILVIVSAGATFMTQRLVRQAQTTVPVGTAATVQNLMQYLIPVFTLGSGLFFPLGVLLYWFTSNTWTMGQQFYINKYHPHTPKEQAPVGELGRTLAPPPGARPDRNRRQVTLDKPVEPSGDDQAIDTTNPTPSRPPRPGQRPNRPAGQRPNRSGSKRPNQPKKRR